MAANFFHVDHDTAYTGKGLHKIGDVIDTSSRKHNPYYEMAMDFHSVYHDGIRPVPLLEFFRSATACERATDVMPDVHHIIESHLKIIREMVFESVRAEHFPHLPSRMRCIWVCQTEREAHNWAERLSDRRNAQVLKVSVEGRLHTASDGHLKQDSQTMEQIVSNASRYWRGEQAPGFRSETLLEGSMTVLEVLE